MSRPLRVAFFTPNLIRNGVASWFKSLLKHCNPQRMEFTGCLVYGFGQTADDICREISRYTQIHSDPPLGRMPWLGGASIQQHANLQEAADAASRDADVILTWGTTDILQHFEQRAPVLLVGHGTTWKPADTWDPASACRSRVTYYAAVSEAAADVMAPPDLPRVPVIYSGADVERCAPTLGRKTQRSMWGVTDNTLVIACIGQQVESKHPRSAALAAAELGNACAVYYGADKTGGTHPQIMQLVRDLPEHVRAYPPRADLGDVLAGADVLLLHSDTEAFSLVTCEAWVAGLPVVSTAVGAVPELEKQYGKLVYELPVDATQKLLADCIYYAKGDPDGIAQRARHIAWKNWTATAMAYRWESHLHSLGLLRSNPLNRPKVQDQLRVFRSVRAAVVMNEPHERMLKATASRAAALHRIGIVVVDAQGQDAPTSGMHTHVGGNPGAGYKIHQTLEEAIAAVVPSADLVIHHGVPEISQLIGPHGVPLVAFSWQSAKQDWVAPTARHSRALVNLLPSVDHRIGYPEQYRSLVTDVDSASFAHLCQRLTKEATPGARAQPVRVLFLCPHICMGGAEQWMNWLIDNSDQDRTRYVGVVKCAGNICSGRDPLLRLISKVPVYFTAQDFDEKLLASDDTGGRIRSGPDEVRLVAKAIDDLVPDVIVSWGVGGLGAVLPKSWRGPVVHVAHGDHHCGWTKWVSECAVARATHLVGVSFRAVQALPADLQRRATVIYNGVADDHIKPWIGRDAQRDAWGFAPTDKVIGFLGRMSLAKDTMAAVRAAAHLGEPYWAALVGDDSWNHTIHQTAQTLPERYKMLGIVEPVGDALSAFDVMMFASKSESFGLAMVEAWRAGVPVIATHSNIGGEISGQYGDLFVPVPHDAPAHILAEAVKQALSPEFQSVVTRARQVAAREFDMDRMVDRWSTYFEHILLEPFETCDSSRRRQQLAQPAETTDRGHVWVDVVAVVETEQDLVDLDSIYNQQDASVFVWVLNKLGRPIETRLNARVFYETDFQGIWDLATGLLGQYRSEHVAIHHGGRNHPRRLITTVSRMVEQGASAAIAGAMLPTGYRNPAIPADRDDLSFHPGTLIVRRDCLIDLRGFLLVKETAADFVYRCAERERIVTVVDETLLEDATEPVPSRFVRRDTFEWERRVSADVVLPFRGMVPFLKEAMDSIFQQQGISQITLHVIDDASPDPDREIHFLLQRCRALTLLGIKVRTYRCPHNIGQFQAVNAVLPYLEHKYFLIQDADDISEPNRVNVTVNSLRMSGAHVFGATMVPFGDFTEEDLKHFFLRSHVPKIGDGHFLANPTIAFERAAFELVGGYSDFGDVAKNKASLDTELLYRMQYAGFRFFISGNPLVRWRRHNQSCTQNADSGHATANRWFADAEATRRRQAYIAAGRCDPTLYGTAATPVKLEVL